MRKLSLLALPLALVSGVAHAQVVLTEVMPNPNGSDNAEWIEIHNTGAVAVSIADWTVNDFGPATPRVYAFPAGTMLAADQVIIVARQATEFITMATTEGFAITTPDYELAEGADEAAVPNLAVTVQGSGGFALGNSGDGVQLSDAAAAVVSTAEWGNGRTEVPGSPAAGPGSGETIGRIATSGDSSLDFVVGVPTPGVGLQVGVPVPPSILNETRSPAAAAYGAPFTASATVTDADGVFGVEWYFASATSSVGVADANYVAVAATESGNQYSVTAATIQSVAGLNFADPTAFNQRYLRYWVFGLDTNADGASLPAMAVTTADNANFFWENVLPSTGNTPLADARAQDANEEPLWAGHTVRVQGVVLTTKESFLTGRTNFFIADETTVDAIRIFDDELIPETIAPGDVVVVTGKVDAFRGVRQIGRDERAGQPEVDGPEITVTVMGTAAVPMVMTTIDQLLLNGEANESQLVEIADVQAVADPDDGTPPPADWPSNGNVFVSDGTGTLLIRSVSATDLPGTAVPMGMFTIRGILTQFAPGGTGGYQVQPRSMADVVGAGPPVDGGMEDAGEMDGGNMDTDSGMQADAGTNPGSDAGTTAPRDGGGTTTPIDSGVFGGGGRDDEGGCGCASSESRGAALPSAALVMLLGVALLRRRRR